MRILKGDYRFYLPARGITTTLSLLFAFLYSKDLGVVNRSYVAVVMTFSILIIVIITSGTTLTLRNLPKMARSQTNISSFISLIIIETFSGLILFSLTLIGFSIYKGNLPLPLIYVSLLYFVLSALHLIFNEILFAFDKFKTAGKLDILTILLQISLYFMGGALTDLSIAVRLLLSFAGSYLIIVILCLFKLRSEFTKKLDFGNPKIFLAMSKGNHSIGTVLGLVDRFDRLIIAWFLPVVLLGKYTVMSSFISFFRFIPDSFSKILVNSKSEFWRQYLRNPLILFLGLTGIIASMIVTSQYLIERMLGSDWLLPWGVSLVFALQELARGTFQMLGNYKVSVGASTQTHNASLILFFTAGPLAILISWWQGIIGVPIGFLISYSGVLIYMKRKNGFV